MFLQEASREKAQGVWEISSQNGKNNTLNGSFLALVTLIRAPTVYQQKLSKIEKYIQFQIQIPVARVSLRLK